MDCRYKNIKTLWGYEMEDDLRTEQSLLQFAVVYSSPLGT
jgi:hypothetical protein